MAKTVVLFIMVLVFSACGNQNGNNTASTVSDVAGNQEDKKATFICSYYGDNAKFNQKEICGSVSFASNRAAEDVVDRILGQIGLKRNFVVMECPEIENCLAVNLPGGLGQIRYIIYDTRFLKRIESKTQTDWAAISIMAHEIGHHLNGHTVDGAGSRPEKELEADEFSGFVLYQLGASLVEAQAAMNNLADENKSSTHPAKTDRLAAIEKGWNKARERFPKTNSNETDIKTNAEIKNNKNTKFYRVGDYNEGLAIAKYNGKYGFVNVDGKLVIECKYEFAGSFTEGLAPVQLNKNWGFLNKLGELAIPCKYEDVRLFFEGLAGVKWNGKFGFVNKNEEWVIERKYEDVRCFSEGLVGVKLNSKWGFIDKKGDLVIKFKYSDVGGFKNGLATAELNGEQFKINKKGERVN